MIRLALALLAALLAAGCREVVELAPDAGYPDSAATYPDAPFLDGLVPADARTPDAGP